MDVKRTMVLLPAIFVSTYVLPVLAAQKVTCTGILVKADLVANSDFPAAIVFDQTDVINTKTCIVDMGHAGHWPRRGACQDGEQCTITGPYYKKINNTYYMRQWDSVGMPGQR